MLGTLTIGSESHADDGDLRIVASGRHSVRSMRRSCRRREKGARTERDGAAAGVRIRCGELALDPKERRVWIGGAAIHLTAKEFRLAEILARRAGEVMSREEVMRELYRDAAPPSARSVEVFVCHLRRKLWAASGGRTVIGTMPGRGYVLNPA